MVSAEREPEHQGSGVQG